jgi:hypothetical protein
MGNFDASESEQDIRPGDLSRSMMSMDSSMIESANHSKYKDVRESFDPRATLKVKEHQCHWCKTSFGFFRQKTRHNCSQCGFSVCSQCLGKEKVEIEGKLYKVCCSCFTLMEN